MRTGEIVDDREYQGLLKAKAHGLLDRKGRERLKHLRQMVIPPTPQQLRSNKAGRNEPCPCGSGVKLKRCCLIGTERTAGSKQSSPEGGE